LAAEAGRGVPWLSVQSCVTLLENLRGPKKVYLSRTAREMRASSWGYHRRRAYSS
jgi:hypothetical protein